MPICLFDLHYQKNSTSHTANGYMMEHSLSPSPLLLLPPPDGDFTFLSYCPLTLPGGSYSATTNCWPFFPTALPAPRAVDSPQIIWVKLPEIIWNFLCWKIMAKKDTQGGLKVSAGERTSKMSPRATPYICNNSQIWNHSTKIHNWNTFACLG